MIDKPFAIPMILGGLTPDDPSTVGPALASTEASAVDSDGDGTADVAELRAGRNPNINAVTAADAIVCPPQYGCGARVAPAPPLDGSGAVLALLVAGALALRLRWRSS
jgi:hypothetical protein